MDEKRKKRVKDLLLEVALLYLGLLLMLYFIQRHMMYFPDARRPVPAAFGMGDMSVIDVTTVDNLRLSGWYKAPAAGRPVIILFHGNGGNIGGRNFKARQFISQGYGFLLAGYRGYGGNPGSPSEQGFYADARAYLGWLAKQGIAPSQIVLYGESIGTGVAVQAASETPGYKALVLESPFASMVDMARKQYFFVPVSLLLKDRYDNIGKIKNIKIPLLVLHGAADPVVPYSQGKQLFDAANEPKKMETFFLGGHVDLYNYGAGAEILAFLEVLDRTR
jgi:uncharacterized protein